MEEIILQIDGMACSMCESTVKNALRKALGVKKIKASHRDGTVRIVSEQVLDPGIIREALKSTGYRLTGMESRAVEPVTHLLRRK